MYELMMYPVVKGPLRALQAHRTPCSILSYCHYTPSYTPSNILSLNHSTRG